MLIAAIVLITAALVFYSIGVWAERLRRLLRWWHAAFFAAGFSCDLSGTIVMTFLASAGGRSADGIARILAIVMAATGTLALALMALHLGWAVAVLLRNRAGELRQFHRLSVVVWAIWLVPFVTGAVAANIG